MKKIIIAAIAFSMLVACGGNGNGNEKKVTVEDQAIEYSEKLLKAMEAGDFDKIEKLEAEMEKWYESLSEEDQEKADDAADEWGMENMTRIERATENLW